MFSEVIKEEAMSMREKVIIIVQKVLLIYVFVTIGFSIGKEATLRLYQRRMSDSGALQSVRGEAETDKVVVYYFHTTFRCVTCNDIEQRIKNLIQREFADAYKAGRIEWKEVDFQQEEVLAKRYGVMVGCVVVANIRGGKDVDFQRLDEIWTKFQEPSGFDQYIISAVKKYLDK